MNRSKLNKTAGLVFILASLLSFSSSANAQSVRSRGMGGAFIGLSNDESATIYNPAGLSQIEGREASIQAKVNERDIYVCPGRKRNHSCIWAFLGQVLQECCVRGNL